MFIFKKVYCFVHQIKKSILENGNFKITYENFSYEIPKSNKNNQYRVTVYSRVDMS